MRQVSAGHLSDPRGALNPPLPLPQTLSQKESGVPLPHSSITIETPPEGTGAGRGETGEGDQPTNVPQVYGQKSNASETVS